MPEDTLVSFYVSRDEYGALSAYGREYVSGGEYWIDAETCGDKYYVFIQCYDGRNPGEGRLYRLDSMEYRGRLVPDADSLELILSYESTPTLVSTSEGGVLAFERREDCLRLVQFGADGGLVQESLLPRDFEPTRSRPVTGEGWALCDELGRIQVFLEEDGLYVPAFSCDVSGVPGYEFQYYSYSDPYTQERYLLQDGRLGLVCMGGLDTLTLIVADGTGVLGSWELGLTNEQLSILYFGLEPFRAGGGGRRSHLQHRGGLRPAEENHQKRAVLTLLILALVSGLGLGAAALAVNSKRDAAYIAAVSETGGGSLARGAEARRTGRVPRQDRAAGSYTPSATTRPRTKAPAASS